MSAKDKATIGKTAAAQLALDEFVKSGMSIGLGSGSTAVIFTEQLAGRVAQGLSIRLTATSNQTRDLARGFGLEVMTLDDLFADFGKLDLTIDGADEIDDEFNMIKGGGACLLWEKIVAQASDRMIALVDESKLVENLGAYPLPVEVVRFSWRTTRQRVIETLAEFVPIRAPVIRREQASDPIVTDSGNFILDCACESITRCDELTVALNSIPGVVENGLFVSEADGAVIGKADGSAQIHMR